MHCIFLIISFSKDVTKACPFQTFFCRPTVSKFSICILKHNVDRGQHIRLSVPTPIHLLSKLEQFIFLVYYTPANEVWSIFVCGVYRNHPVCLSVCPSIHASGVSSSSSSSSSVRAPGRLQLDLLAVFDVTFEGLIDQQSVTENSTRPSFFEHAS